MRNEQFRIEDVRVVLMAGGIGARLRPLTLVIPKPLVPLGERSIIDVLISQLAAYGLRHVTIATGYLAELVAAVCGDGAKHGVEINYCKEETPLGTAGALNLVARPTDPLLVMNGDLLTTLNFRNMVEHHVAKDADLTIGTYRREDRIDFGVVDVDDQGDFIGFREKPVHSLDVSMGVNVLSAKALELLRPGERLDMPDLILRVSESGGRVVCYREDCYWLDIGRVEDYTKAQDEYKKNPSLFLPDDSQRS